MEEKVDECVKVGSGWGCESRPYGSLTRRRVVGFAKAMIESEDQGEECLSEV